MADEQKPEAKGKAYPVLESVRHNGELYAPGEAIPATDMTAKQAKPLIEAGVLGKLA